MSYIDIFVLVIIGLGLFFGLFGRWQNKLVALCSVAASAVTSYFICTPITNAVLKMDSGILSFIGGKSGTPILEFIQGLLKSKKLPVDLSSLADMVPGLVKVIVFWLCAIVLMLVLGLLTKIIFGIIFRHTKKGTAIKTLGLIGAVKGALVAIILVFPVFAFAPLLKNLTSIPNLPESIQPVVQMVEDHTNKSKAVAVTDWVFKNTKMQMMTYEHNGQTMYLYDDLNGISGLVQLSSLLTGGDPIQALAQMDASQLQEAIASIGNSPMLQETITNVVSKIVSQQMPGMEIGEINFENEGKMLAKVVSVFEIETIPPQEEGKKPEYKVNISEAAVNTLLENTDELAEVLADSDLIVLFAKDLEGILEVTSDQKTAIDNALSSIEGLDTNKLELLQEIFKAKAEA
ncbi:MAG: hypothetical protein MJ152_00650 [Clostridia bacterium]|nr:hypothetical protein [Clostridia bacterium]